VVVDGAPIASAALRDGATLALGPARLTLRGDTLHVDGPPPAFALHVERVGRSVGGKPLLVDVSFTVLSGEVVALVGPSGAGKTTLLGALSGAAPADSGVVRLGSEPLAAALARVPALVGVVPQDDIVVPELTVEESLGYAARLRLPAGERAAAVNHVLTALGLEGARGARIGDPEARGISGGQRKRVNLGQELLTDDTRVLFLDEPTSGLDPRSAEDFARLARRLADDGRIVVVVTHDLSDALMAQVDQLVVMAPGGHLAWFGPVPEALAHFGVTSAPKLFARLSDHASTTWAQRYRDSATAARWVTLRSKVADAQLRSTPPTPRSGTGGLVAQWLTLTGRAARAKLRDRTAVAVLVVQPLLVGLVVLAVFPEPTAGLVFLLTLASFWFGMSAAVRELITDRLVWRRERRIGVSAVAWVGAKATLLAGTVALQCVGCTLLAAAGIPLGAAGFSVAGLAAVLVLTGLCGAAIGLWVSTWWRRSDAAVGTIVLLLVPQIAFVGMLTPLDHLGPIGRALSWVTPLRYALHLALVQGTELRYLKLGAWQTRPVSGELFLLGLRPAGEGSLGLPAPLLVAVLVTFALAACGAAVVGLRRDRA
jgi:ABC-type multidrug transport system ATPase subunit